MTLTNAMVSKQLKDEYMYHKQLIFHPDNDSEYQQLTTNKLNQISHQASELSFEYFLRRINERYDDLYAPKFKIILLNYTNRNKLSNNKNKLDLIIKVLDRMITKFDLENELSYLFN